MPSQVWKNVEALDIRIYPPGEFKESKEGKSSERKEARGSKEKISSKSQEHAQRLFPKKR